MKNKTAAEQFQLIPETDMPFNLIGETIQPPPPIPEATNETTANLFLTET